jgi:hypothetical protein
MKDRISETEMASDGQIPPMEQSLKSFGGTVVKKIIKK